MIGATTGHTRIDINSQNKTRNVIFYGLDHVRIPTFKSDHFISKFITTSSHKRFCELANMNSISRSVSQAIVPAVRRAASSAIPAAKQLTKEGFKAVEILYAVPPLLAIVGYGGTVCYHESGALRRILRSFAEVPH